MSQNPHDLKKIQDTFGERVGFTCNDRIRCSRERTVQKCGYQTKESQLIHKFIKNVNGFGSWSYLNRYVAPVAQPCVVVLVHENSDIEHVANFRPIQAQYAFEDDNMNLLVSQPSVDRQFQLGDKINAFGYGNCLRLTQGWWLQTRTFWKVMLTSASSELSVSSPFEKVDNN